MPSVAVLRYGNKRGPRPRRSYTRPARIAGHATDGMDELPGTFAPQCRLAVQLSTQTKGRVERVHGTHQDRLVKKLRRKQICTHEAANVYLKREYLPEHNQRFARAAAKPEDYHRRAPRRAELDGIFRLESERTISEDWVVRYENRFFQLHPQSQQYAPAKGTVLVCEGRHGNMTIEYRGRALRWEEISAPTRPGILDVSATNERHRVPTAFAKRKWVPAAHHPWRDAARRGAQKRALREADIAKRPSLAGSCAAP